MPRHLNPCSYLPRRLQIVASLTTFIIICVILLGSSSPSDPYLDNVPFGTELEKGAHDIVEHVNPFAQLAHKPLPEQKNSSSGAVRWFSDFKWRNPFSSSTTFDEERAVLPPLIDRPPIYTYLDPSGRRKDEKSKKAEMDLVRIWRRAWWAQGFKPMVLGSAEAMNNPAFKRVQNLKLQPELELEMMRWLAWGNMGTGILCNWLALPMANHDDPLLSYLRRGEYANLTRYTGLENGLFVGTKGDVDKAILTALLSSNLEHAMSIYEAVPREMFYVDSEHKAIAFYSTKVIAEKYGTITEKLEKDETRGDGLAMLPPLVTSHLHTTWQNIYSSGIAVVKPVPQNTTGMIEPAMQLAYNLSQCTDSPLPASCPPNRDTCKPCVSSQPMRVITPPVFRNWTTLFNIATVPHPYTFQSLLHSKDGLDLPFIRRKTKRDVWIAAATKELIGDGKSAFVRLAPLKELVASDYGAARTLWLTAERPPDPESEKDLDELDWIFGFRIPRAPHNSGKSETPVPGPERRPPPPKEDFQGPATSGDTLKLQHAILEQSRRVVRNGEKGGDKAAVQVRNIIEAWNLADTEAWKFVRAWNARRRIERRGWEEEEDRYLGKGIYERWKDYMKGDDAREA